jgi:hypothetical protein
MKTMPHSNGDKPSIVGVGEIAEILQVPTTHVSMMIQRKTIPEHDWVINSGRTKVWLLSTIMDWAKNTGKLPFNKMMEVDIRKER